MKTHIYVVLSFLVMNIWLTHISYGYGNKITHPAGS